VGFADVPGTSDFAGTLEWIKPGTNGVLYPAAFDTDLDFIGSAYKAPAKGERALDLVNGANNAKAEASGGNIGTALDKVFTLDATNKFIIAPDAQALKLSLKLGSGLLTGSFKDGAATITLKGVIFQDQNKAAGFSLGTTLTDKFELLPNP
jgi:hypothetical protein